MSYYPKSRILSNLKANPGEFTNISGISYTGDYYMTFDGKYYSGTGPNTSYSIELVRANQPIESRLIPTLNNIIYNRINPNLNILELKDPVSYYPVPTPQDYEKGKIIRYFAKQRITRKFKIIEIDRNTFEDIWNEKGVYNFPMWKVTSLFWQISGPLHDERPNGFVVTAGVIDTNQRVTEQKDKVFFGIKQYLTDYKQFYK